VAFARDKTYYFSTGIASSWAPAIRGYSSQRQLTSFRGIMEAVLFLKGFRALIRFPTSIVKESVAFAGVFPDFHRPPPLFSGKIV
jgi:hypothetical protein